MASTVTSLLNLTTVFTPPASCLGAVFTLSPTGYDVWTSGSTITRGIAPGCYPQDYASMYAGTVYTGDPEGVSEPGGESIFYIATTWQSYYSPGVCPSGYTTARTLLYQSNVFATCCPSEYSLDFAAVTQVCTHSLNGTGDSFLVAGAGSTDTVTSPAAAVAAPILVAYEESIVSPSTAGEIASTSTSVQSTLTASASPAATVTNSGVAATATISSPVSSSATSMSTSSESAEDISATDAGAAIGGALGLTFLILAGLWYQRRRRRIQKGTEPEAGAFLAGTPSTIDDEDAWRWSGGKSELAAEAAYIEVPATVSHRLSELPVSPDSMNIFELPGDSPVLMEMSDTRGK